MICVEQSWQDGTRVVHQDDDVGRIVAVQDVGKASRSVLIERLAVRIGVSLRTKHIQLLDEDVFWWCANEQASHDRQALLHCVQWRTIPSARMRRNAWRSCPVGEVAGRPSPSRRRWHITDDPPMSVPLPILVPGVILLPTHK